MSTFKYPSGIYLLLVIILLPFSNNILGQTTLFSENFEAASEGELSTTAFNGWKQYTVSATVSDWAITNNCPISGSYSLTLHAYGVYCEYAWDDTGNEVAYYGTLIDATAYNTTILSFDWNCGGESGWDYGRVCYSTNGTTWTDFANSGTYVNAGTTSVTNLDISDVDGTSFYLGFRWINDGNTGTDPGFNVDNIVLKATANCATTAGTASASPASITSCSSSTLTLTGSSGTIQWQSSPDNSTWTNISGATSSTYVASPGATTYYRAAVTSGCTAYSNSTTVTVTNDGTNYYVNDNSLTGDVFCSAVGNAGNNGTSPCTPKTSLQDIFNTYNIDPGDTIFVDAGNYTMGLDVTSSTDEGSAAFDVVIIGAGNTLTNITAPAADDIFYFDNVLYFLVKDMHLISTQASNYNYFLYECNHHLLDNCHLEHSANTNIYFNEAGGAYDLDLNAIANCTIENSSASGYNIWIRGDADNDTIRNCTITSTGTAGAKAIVLNDYSVGLHDGWPTEIHLFDNTITADDYGFYGKVVNGNTMEYYNIHDNNITINSSDQADGAGIWLNNHGLSSARISGIYNNVISGGKNGIYLTAGVDYVHFYNNYICNSEYGVYVSDDASDDNDLQHNSIYSSKECVHFALDSKGWWYVRNNIFYSTANSSYACLSAGNSSSTFVRCDYNLYYAPNGAYIAQQGASYYTLAGWQGVNHHDGAGNGDVSSMVTDPNFQNAGNCDLDLLGNYQTGTTIAAITTDINGYPRSVPTIGAWEKDSPLPVLFTEIEGECENGMVHLTWATESEINNDYFKIEKSNDGFSFELIGLVQGAGNSNSYLEYNFYDENSQENLSYYRLVQVDFDGSETIAKTIAVTCEDISGLEISGLFPNPADNNLTIGFVSPSVIDVSLSVYDVAGKLIHQNVLTANKGYNSLALAVTDYSPGIYVIKIIDARGEQSVERFIKK